jgi:hypothetical protein
LSFLRILKVAVAREITKAAQYIIENTKYSNQIESEESENAYLNKAKQIYGKLIRTRNVIPKSGPIRQDSPVRHPFEDTELDSKTNQINTRLNLSPVAQPAIDSGVLVTSTQSENFPIHTINFLSDIDRTRQEEVVNNGWDQWGEDGLAVSGGSVENEVSEHSSEEPPQISTESLHKPGLINTNTSDRVVEITNTIGELETLSINDDHKPESFFSGVIPTSELPSEIGIKKSELFAEELLEILATSPSTPAVEVEVAIGTEPKPANKFIKTPSAIPILEKAVSVNNVLQNTDFFNSGLQKTKIPRDPSASNIPIPRTWSREFNPKNVSFSPNVCTS